MNARKRGPCSTLFLGIALLVIGVRPISSQCVQPPGSFTFRQESRAVLVDVVVQDKSGRPINGLKREAFHLFEDNTPETLASFDFHTPGQNANVQDFLPALPGPSEEYSNFRKAPGEQSITVLLFDSLNTAMADQQRARKQMISFLKSLPPGQSVALFTLGTGLHMVQDFTGKSDVLIAAANQLSSAPSPLYVEHGPDQIREDDSLSGADLLKQAKLMNINAKDIPNPQDRARAVSEEIDTLMAEKGTYRMDVRVRLTLSAMEQLAHALAAYPGRKKLIWISGSFPLSLGPDMDTGFSGHASELLRDYTQQLRLVETLLARTQIAVYAIDVKGVMGTGAGAAVAGADAVSMNPDTRGTGLYEDRQQTSIANTQATMQELAEHTGGRAFINQNNLALSVKQAFDDGANYYILSYVPNRKDYDGNYRVIKLKVDGVKDSELHYRRGYFSVSDTVLDPNQQHHSFVAAMQRNAPESSGVLFKAKLSDAGAKDKIQIDFAIDARDITFKDEQNCAKKLNMVVGAVAWTLDKKEPTRIFQIFDPVLTPEAFASYESNGIKVRQQIILGPGPAIVRLGVMDLATGKIGTVNIPYKIFSADR